MPSNAYRRLVDVPFPVPVFDYLLLKVAARCNLNCTYCYWFRDSSVYAKPKVLGTAVERALLTKLEEHIRRYGLASFSILLHGGEPTLFGKSRTIALCERLREIEARTGCALHLAMTTNGTLVDAEWAVLCRYFDIGVTVSVDGPAAVHDRARVDHAGRGSFAKVRAGIDALRDHDVDLGFLAVCDPTGSPRELLEFFADDLQVARFDVLVPDATHNDAPTSIADYYCELFDLWFARYADRVQIRYLRSIMKGLLGGDSQIESIGYGPIQTCALTTDGALEPLDVLRITGDRATQTGVTIFDHTFQDVCDDPVWLEAFTAAQRLPDRCSSCRFARSCGGGFLPHRYSTQNRFANPSVYCDDIQRILDHIGDRITPTITVAGPGWSLPLAAASR